MGERLAADIAQEIVCRKVAVQDVVFRRWFGQGDCRGTSWPGLTGMLLSPRIELGSCVETAADGMARCEQRRLWSEGCGWKVGALVTIGKSESAELLSVASRLVVSTRIRTLVDSL